MKGKFTDEEKEAMERTLAALLDRISLLQPPILQGAVLISFIINLLKTQSNPVGVRDEVIAIMEDQIQ